MTEKVFNWYRAVLEEAYVVRRRRPEAMLETLASCFERLRREYDAGRLTLEEFDRLKMLEVSSKPWGKDYLGNVYMDALKAFMKRHRLQNRRQGDKEWTQFAGFNQRIKLAVEPITRDDIRRELRLVGSGRGREIDRMLLETYPRQWVEEEAVAIGARF